MSKQIGDYIHAHLENYKRFGITKKTEGAYIEYDFHNYVQNRADKIIKKIPDKTNDIENIQKEINTLIKKNSTKDSNNDAMQKFIIEVMEKKFKYDMNNYNINWETGDLTTKEGLEKITKLQKLQDGRQRDLSVITSRLDLINKYIDKLVNESTVKALRMDIAEIKKEVEKRVKDIKTEIEDFRRTYDITNNKVLIDEKNGKDLYNIEEHLNDIISKYITLPPTNLIKGDFFEVLSAIAMLKAKKDGVISLEKVSTAVIGTTGKSNLEINLNKFSKEIQKAFKEQLTAFNLTDGNTLISATESQNKIDVKIEWGKNKHINASIKNININRGIHIVSNTSLLTILQNENTDMINHYLNITSTHEDGLSNRRVEAHKQLELLIAVKSLVGHKTNEQFAELFIVNNNQSSKDNSIYIVTMASVINKLKEQDDLYEVTTNDANFTSKIFDNTFVGNKAILNKQNGVTRIGNLLLDVYDTKVSTKLLPSAVRDIKTTKNT